MPSLIIVFAMTVVPLCYAFFLSFQDYRLNKPQFAFFNGLNNYIEMFTNKAVLTSIGNTVFYTVVSVSASVVFGLLAALIVNQIKTGKSFYRIAIFAPMMLSSVVVGVIWKFLFNNQLGIVGYILSQMNIAAPDWFGNPRWAMASIIMVDVWQWTSYVFLLCLAGLESMNMEPVESARIDGANAVQIFWHIKLPTILPLIQIAAIFRFTWAFRGFDSIFTLTKGGPGIATETMAISIWRYAFQQYNIGLSSSLSVLMFAILMVLAMLILRKTFRKED